MKHIKLFENYISDIEIDDIFDNELDARKAWELNNNALLKHIDFEENKKLNLFFGTHKEIKGNEYNFDVKYGTFGTPIINLKGSICKYIDFYDKNIYYLLKVFIYINIVPSKGRRHVVLKFDTLDEVLGLFNSFEKRTEE
jgi:hypothetical protein